MYTAVYLINRLPTKGLQKLHIPATLWYGRKQKFDPIKSFGCLAYVQKSIIKSKLVPKTEKCVFLGYIKGGCKFLSLETNKIVESKDVVYKDDTFPFKDRKIHNYLLPETGDIHPHETVNDVEETKIINEEINGEEVTNENVESDVRKSTRNKKKTEYLKDYLLCVDTVPKSYQDI